MLESIEFGIMFTDLDHVSLACNQAFGDIWAIDPKVVVSSDVQAVRDMVRHRVVDLDAWLANLQSVYDDPLRTQVDDIELRNPRQIVHRRTVPVFGEIGEVVGRLWTFQDVTEDRRYERMRDTLHDISLAFDPEPAVVYRAATEAVAQYYGSSAYLSIRVGSFMHFRAVGGVTGRSKALPGNAVAFSYCQFCMENDEPLIIQDGSKDPRYSNVLPCRLGLTRYAGAPLKNPSGETIGTLCVLDNRSDEPLDEEDLRFLSLVAMRISSELDREAQLKSLRHDLKRTHAQLLQSEKLAVSGTLAASIAHDIRNILSTVSLEIAMGKDQPVETLDAVQVQLDRFGLLAHRLLSYARPKEVARERVDLPKTLERVMELLQSHLKISRIESSIVVPPSLRPVLADTARLDHLFVNLGLNAIQAMKAGGTLGISCHQAKRHITVTVSDTGPGIPKERMTALFEPFNSSRPDGFGLGLYSCQQIAKESGGNIEVESELGVGTKFIVTLPTS